MKIVVFGGSGFLGSHVCDKLSDAGYQVTVYDMVQSPYLRSDQEMRVGDILDEKSVRQAVSDARIVFNFAGIADIGEANSRPVETVKYNILGNTLILEACRKANVKRYVFASSVYVYSEAGGFYKCSKLACEKYIETFYQNYGLEYTILRYGSLYGPRSDTNNAIHRFVKEAMETGGITYYGSPEALREYIHVEDAALCSLEILKPEYTNQHIILTGHEKMSIGNMLRMIAEMLGRDIEFNYKPDHSNTHYAITPYKFSPRVGKKMVPALQVDLGEGVLRVIEELYKETTPDMRSKSGNPYEE